MVEEVGGQRDVGADGGFGFGIWVGIGNEVMREEFVGVDKIVGC